MPPTAGDLGDDHPLSERVRRYANEVVEGGRWPLTPEHVDLERVTFETSTRMQRKHGTCVSDGNGGCTVRVAEKTYERAGFEATAETIRHELVHVYQYQTDGVEAGHGPSFGRWVDPLDLDGRCGDHYETGADDYTYTFHCSNCGFIGGRYRLCKAVRTGIDGGLYCKACESEDVDVRRDGDVVTEAPGRREKN